jgi:hypothetical protein
MSRPKHTMWYMFHLLMQGGEAGGCRPSGRNYRYCWRMVRRLGVSTGAGGVGTGRHRLDRRHAAVWSRLHSPPGCSRGAVSQSHPPPVVSVDGVSIGAEGASP